MLPKGMIKAASALKWHSLFQVRAWFSGLGGGVSWVS
jgi:hypothetical protein